MEKFTSATTNIFALTDLPEVVKGAMFSRYSRTSLGLRELYEKEFQDDTGRADDFYERILDGYGDDSVAELGGAHLAMEQISIIATKIIQDGRIGAAYLEKSTRYVDFGKKDADGNYGFQVPPELDENDALGDLYVDTCTLLFNTYVELLPLVRTRLEKEAERDFAISEVAHARAIKSQAFDICRGLLPASTKTNMGIFANGRFYEAMLMKLMTHPLGEMQQIGLASREALSHVIPSFIRRADHSHRHFTSYANFQNQLRRTTANLIDGLDCGEHPEALGATLIHSDDKAEDKVMAGILYDGWGRASMNELLDGASRLSRMKMEGMFERLANVRTDRRHKLSRGLEHADYVFEIIADYGVYRDLHRHRILTHQRQPVGCSMGFNTPPEIERPEWQMIEDIYIGAMQNARKTWMTMVDAVGLELAQYVVPLAYNIRWTMKANLREWLWIVELRTTPQGHPNYRKICQHICREIIRVHPTFEPFFKFVNMEGYELGRSQAEQRQEGKT